MAEQHGTDSHLTMKMCPCQPSVTEQLAWEYACPSGCGTDPHLSTAVQLTFVDKGPCYCYILHCIMEQLSSHVNMCTHALPYGIVQWNNLHWNTGAHSAKFEQA